jgi:GAF domain
MWKRLPSSVKVFVKILWPVIATILTLAFSGIVGNRADSALLQLLPFLQQTTTVAVARWLLILIVLLPSLAIGLPLALMALRYYRSQQAATRLLFQEFLEDTLELFKDGCRISILQPDSNDPEFLTIWQSLRVPFETIQRTRFYIGSNSADRRVGIAGLAFQQQKLMTVHLYWNPDNLSYYAFVKRPTKKGMPYRSMVAVPIINNNNAQQCLGVLCLDSTDEQAFDTKRVQDGLRAVTDRVSAILLILENYG